MNRNEFLYVRRAEGEKWAPVVEQVDRQLSGLLGFPLLVQKKLPQRLKYWGQLYPEEEAFNHPDHGATLACPA